MGQKLRGTHQLLVSADDVNLLGGNVNTIEKKTVTLIDAGKEVGLEANTEETKYMLLSRHQNAGQNHDIKTGNRCFENVAINERLGTDAKNRNCINEEMRNRLNSNIVVATIQLRIYFLFFLHGK
jgi:hypothetical protein